MAVGSAESFHPTFSNRPSPSPIRSRWPIRLPYPRSHLSFKRRRILLVIQYTLHYTVVQNGGLRKMFGREQSRRNPGYIWCCFARTLTDATGLMYLMSSIVLNQYFFRTEQSLSQMPCSRHSRIRRFESTIGHDSSVYFNLIFSIPPAA